MWHEECWQITFELTLGLDLSWLWSSSDSGRALGFLSSDSRRCASDGKRERNDLSSMSSSVIESSNFTEYSVATESADWKDSGQNNSHFSGKTTHNACHQKIGLYLFLRAGCAHCPSKGSHRQRCEPGPPLNYCSCLSLVSSSPFDQNEVDSTGYYCCHHHLKRDRNEHLHTLCAYKTIHLCCKSKIIWNEKYTALPDGGPPGRDGFWEAVWRCLGLWWTLMSLRRQLTLPATGEDPKQHQYWCIDRNH